MLANSTSKCGRVLETRETRSATVPAAGLSKSAKLQGFTQTSAMMRPGRFQLKDDSRRGPSAKFLRTKNLVFTRLQLSGLEGSISHSLRNGLPGWKTNPFSRNWPPARSIKRTNALRRPRRANNVKKRYELF